MSHLSHNKLSNTPRVETTKMLSLPRTISSFSRKRESMVNKTTNLEAVYNQIPVIPSKARNLTMVGVSTNSNESSKGGIRFLPVVEMTKKLLFPYQISSFPRRQESTSGETQASNETPVFWSESRTSFSGMTVISNACERSYGVEKKQIMQVSPC